MKCERCGGMGYKWRTVNSGLMKEIKLKCPDCHGTGTKPEPEQDESIVVDIKGSFYSFIRLLGEKSGLNRKFLKNSRVVNMLLYMYESGYTSRNAEIEEKDRHIDSLIEQGIEAKDMEVDLLETIEALKAEIESMRCCGNCGDTQKCSLNNGRGVCNNWTPKSKPCKGSTTTLLESPCNH